MKKIQVHFGGVSEIVGSSDIGLLTLLNEDETRELVVTCDKQMMYQFALRTQPVSGVDRLLPEVLWGVIHNQSEITFEIDINDIIDGEYSAFLMNQDTLEEIPMRASDAILLSVIGKIPVYADAELMRRQGVAYHPQSSGMSLPINIISDQMLQSALDKAVKEENYELASLLRDEMRRRKNRQHPMKEQKS
ncbi:MAG: bifunctional nuclease family protein [Prevotella sp.]|jgi:bifunctional DNase/RNase|nr:bifunctional nuclease family protein [Prevotella sp.]MCH3986065.1 bifunctional nuclease family protein [Prevotella sp.]MCH3992219.1 bifunctional nuclease family protein [Prevotella sp.]MCH4017199.1 bifunctional nuclease family protein [Prevotella sp.]MCH4099884.1 bifunctional nuclease family protein [Prevotella sp.]